MDNITLDPAHPLLTDEALELNATALAAHARVAQRLLNVASITTVTDAQLLDVGDAVALQVNYQLEAGLEAFVVAQVVRGPRRNIYRGGTKKMKPLHPMAQKIISAIRSSQSSTTTAGQ